MKNFKQLIKRSYSAIVGRGLITQFTKPRKFIDKAIEELKEADSELGFMENGLYKDYEKHKSNYIEELTDLATVCIMQIHHLGYDFEEQFEKVVLKNEKRANNGTKK